jgi:cytochrome c oxidase assembly protein subunit 15
LIALVVLLFKSVSVRQVRTLGKVILGVLALQVGLGLGNIIFQFPVSVAVAHNLVGAFLLVTLVTLNHRVFTARLVDSPTTENL